MNTTTMVIIGILVVLAVAGGFYLNYYKKKNMAQLFNHVYDASRQVPKQKKHSFILLMFKETLSSTKKKNNLDKLNNPKYLEIQLIQMGNILKDTSKVQDKTMKRSLALYNEYLTWEKEKNSKKDQAPAAKAS